MTFHFERKLRSRREARKGFTLIELLVVIAIIGILAAVVLVSLNSARIRGRDARRLSDLQAISLAMEVYNDQNNGVYPSSTVANDFTTTTFTELGAALKAAKLLPATPTDPLAGRNYVANVNAITNPTSYIIGADLEQDNQACGADYDGTDVDGAGTNCVDSPPAGETRCGGTDTTGVVDYCICQGPACS